MLKLYHNDMSVCAAKVRTVLAEKGAAWEGVHMDLRAGDTQKHDYLKLNPNAVVPTLVHDGRVIIESTVICEYLDDAFPQNPLKGNAIENARMRLWTKQLDEGLHIPRRVQGLLRRHPERRDARAPPEGHRARHGLADVSPVFATLGEIF